MSTNKTYEDSPELFSWDALSEGGNSRLRYLFERSASPIFLYDPESLQILAANQAACSFYGYEAARFASLNICDISVRSREEIEKAMELVKSDYQQFFSTTHIMADGSLRHVELDATPLDEDNSILLTIVRDVTGRVTAEEKLRRSEENFRTLAESTKDVIWTMDLSGAFTYVSPSVQELRGYTPEEVMAQAPEEALTERSRPILTEGMQVIRQNIASGRPMFTRGNRFELEQFRKDGSTVWTEATLSGIYDSSGKPTGVIGVSRDIAEQKKAQEGLNAALKELEQEAIRRREKTRRLERESRARSAFLIKISRDILTSLNGVVGLSSCLKRSSAQEEQKLLAGAVIRNGEDLLDLANNLITFSGIDAGTEKLNPSPFYLEELLESVCSDHSSRTSAKVKLLQHIAPDVPKVVTGDLARLRQILAGLVGNAIRFTREGEAEIRVSSGEITSSEATLIFSVRDTGPGIPSKILPGLFSNMDSLKDYIFSGRSKTGLGLAVTRGLVRLMRGWISVKSPAEDDAGDERGGGAAFTFALQLGLPSAKDQERLTEERRSLLLPPAPLVFNDAALLESCGGDMEAARHVVTGFLATSPIAAARLRGALYREDCREAASQARLLKNQAGRLKAPGFRAAASEMEKACRAASSEKFAPLLELFLDEMSGLTGALAQWLKDEN